MLFDQPIKDFNRVVEVIQVLRKYRLEELVFLFQLKKLVPKHKRIRWEKGESKMIQYSLWERLRMALEELGPAFIKLGQVLSNRKDLLPEELLDELEKLQSDVSPFDFDTVKSIIENESGKPIDDTFNTFIQEPLASASIGQVHKAVLPDGRQVVVKVQRPGIKRIIDRDISILKRIVNLGQGTLEKKFGFNNALDFIEEFEKTLKRELQYSYEARNMRQFREFYSEYDNFYIPIVYHNLSNDRVLVMEYVKGCKITDIDQLKAWGLVPEEVAESGMDIYLTQMFEYGYFHADPHPGNIIIRQDGVICLVDFGMVGRLSNTEKFAFANMLISMSKQDAQGMGNHFRKLAISDEITNRRAFEADLNELIEDYAMLDISETNLAEIAMRIQEMIYKYRMVVPSSLFLLLRALTILEGIGKTIHPNFNTYDYLQPYGKKVMMDRLNKDALLEEAWHRISQFDYFIRNFPLDLQEIIRSIKRGKLQIEVENKGYEPVIKKINNASNRLSLTLIIVALLIGGSLLVLADLPEGATTKNGIPYLTWGAYLIAGGMSLLIWFKNFWNSRR